MHSKLKMCLFSLLFLLIFAGCSPSATSSAAGAYPVDQAFYDFYREFGGNSTLGPAISPSFTRDGVTYQYVVSGLLAYDPNQSPLDRFYFSKIAAVEWGINDIVEPAPSDTGQIFENGHRIWEEVQPIYLRYGSHILGLPLSGIRRNEAKQRYEQYFEGLGFYRNYSDPAGKIHLLPYGSWMCRENCQYQIADKDTPAASYSRNFSETEQLFLQMSGRLGFGYTGEPLNTPQMASDGNYEMMFENVVLFIDSADGSQMKLRPLPAWLGIQTGQPTKEQKADWLSFYKISGVLGYNVPRIFREYLENHGGLSYSGSPINDYRQLPDDGYSQCYTNLCLEYHPKAPEQLRISPKSLGVDYLENGMNTSVPDPAFEDALQINVWEQSPLLPSGQKQVIYVEASKNNVPLPGIELSLIVLEPDGITKTYSLHPTDESGKTSIELDPSKGPNGSIIQYKVCVLDGGEPQVCFSRSYTIWNQ